MGENVVSKNISIAKQIDSIFVTIDAVQLRSLRIAVAVADRGSFAAAGRHLNIPRAAVSRIIRQLEERTGNRLFRRNTRKVVTTDAGDVLIEAARRALSEIDSALSPIEPNDADLSGHIRMSVSHAFGRSLVLPSIGSFRSQHPNVHIEALLQDKLDDMIEEDISFTVRLGPLPESDLVVRRLGAIRSGLFAAPTFLDSIDQIVDREDLSKIPAVGFRIPGTGQVLPWPVPEGGFVTHSIVPQSVVSSDSIEAVLDFARQGQGVALLPRYLAHAYMSDETLAPVLPDQISMLTDVHICFRERQFMPARVRALIDHLANEIASALHNLDY